MAKYSESPWEIEPQTLDEEILVRCVSDKCVVCGVWQMTGDDIEQDQESLANARLIAAAPELLQACQMMLDKFENDVNPDESGWDAVTAARDAIAKASESTFKFRP